MDDTLKRLLDVESAAERQVQEAKERREALTREALAESRAAQQRFSDRAAEIHSNFKERAVERAEQGVAELQRRYDERTRELRQMADENEAEAVAAALRLITTTAGRGER